MSEPNSAEPNSVRQKRSRKDRPCDHCRRLKHTCRILERGTPCENCVKGKRECTFHGPVVKRYRGQSAIGAGVGRESTATADDGEDAGNAGDMDFGARMAVPELDLGGRARIDRSSVAQGAAAVSAYQRGARSDSGRRQQGPLLADMLGGLDDSASESSGPEVRLVHELSNLCSGLTTQTMYFDSLDQDLNDEEESHYLGSGLFSHARLDHPELGPNSPYRQVSSLSQPVYFLRNPSRIYGVANADYEARRAYTSAVTLLLQSGPLMPTRLIEMFIRTVLPAFPILNHVRLEAACNAWQGAGPFPHAVLVGVFAFMSPALPVLRPRCKELWSIVVQLLDNEYRQPRLQTLQLALLDIGGRPVLNSGGNHVAIGRAVGLAQLLGLHRDSSKWRLPKWERSLRKRTWWTLFIQDKWNAFIYDRPSQLDMSTWDGKDVVPEDDDWAGKNTDSPSLMCFVLLCRFTVVLDSLLPLVQSVGTAFADSTARVHSRTVMQGAAEKLDRLGAEIPLDDPARPLAGHASLRLSHLGLSMLLCRLGSERDLRGSTSSGRHTCTIARLRRQADHAVDVVERMRNLVQDLSLDDCQGYWPVWAPHVFALASSTALRLAVRIAQLSPSGTAPESSVPHATPNALEPVFHAIAGLYTALKRRCDATIGTPLSASGPRTTSLSPLDRAVLGTGPGPGPWSSAYPRHNADADTTVSSAYWEVAEAAIARLVPLITSLPRGIAGSEELLQLVEGSQHQMPDMGAAEGLEALDWLDWLVWPEVGEVAGLGQGGASLGT